jgi:two-component SAPR family response regulator
VAEVLGEAPIAPGILDGLSVLVVEDNGLLCCVLEETLREAGCEVVGPFARLPEAMQAVPALHIDVALLDINIRGQLVSPLAEHLNQRGIPFILTSAYQARDLPRSLQSATQLMKPFTGVDVLERLSEVVAAHSRNN